MPSPPTVTINLGNVGTRVLVVFMMIYMVGGLMA